MDLDFVLFNPPKIKYNFIDLWGEVIFLPKLRKKAKINQQSFSLFNCYNPSTISDVNLTHEAALLQTKGLQFEYEASTEDTAEQQQVQKYIPCLFLSSMVGSKYLLLYFHSSGEDIKLAHPLLNHLRNSYQINVLAMEYPGYSIYKGTPSSECIKNDSLYTYNFVTKKLGFRQEHVIIMGRSIGTGVALDVMRKIMPAALVLISPFASVKSLAKEFVGVLGHYLAKQSFDNRANIASVICPIFMLHGKKDQTISYENTLQLAKKCYAKTAVHLVETMTHSRFDFYLDLTEPLREFLMSHGHNFYEPNMQGPQMPEELFQCPPGYQF